MMIMSLRLPFGHGPRTVTVTVVSESTAKASCFTDKSFPDINLKGPRLSESLCSTGPGKFSGR
eukprot:2511486-Rhodomonas_salina.1